ncbi:MAG TPA: 2-oxoacid:ferredoxin oxidoreductase subunit beta, partial [Anaerolineae bacterium]|nr:2-oxoacid:ferredoxin oxidoreductase subunit beta [Anaerolineae bacterium]
MKRHDQGEYEFLRHHKKFPHLWCSGCGIGIVMGSLLRSIQKLELNQDDVAVISGIGCTGRMPVYMDFNTMHTTHGRALAFATGLKLARPEMEVIVVMGDGDALAIGGNHFIHAARRNIDITSIIVNNNIYGMTGGQSSPTTPLDARSATAPYGHIEPPFPIVDLSMAAGASFVARGTVFHVTELDRLIEQAIVKKGFAVVEAVSYCHTTFGRANDLKSPIAMMQMLKDRGVTQRAAEKLEGDELGDKIVRGVFRDADLPEYTELYDQVIERAHGSPPLRKRKVRR